MKKILIIDDDQDVLESVGTVLQLSGYEVVILQDASHIAQQVRTEQPDVILLDMMLSGLDGRALCYILKSSMHYHSIPIIIFSATELDREEVLRCGADDFVAKPFELESLLQKIERFEITVKRNSL